MSYHRCIIQALLLGTNVLFSATLPPEYGKTHFVIGVSEKELKKGLTPKPLTNNTVATNQLSTPVLFNPSQQSHVLFSPDDDIRSLLFELIAHETESICMAAYMITDQMVAQALLEAHDRGVKVELVTDSSCAKSDIGKIALLQQHNIPVYVYTGVTNKPTTSNLMHNKFIIFGKNKNAQPLVWTGSFNFTHSARLYNQENVVVLTDKSVIDKFIERFNILKKRCGKSGCPAYCGNDKK